MRAPGAVGWLLALASASGAAEQTGFTVKYRSQSRVYLDGGSSQGLREGDRLRVTEGSADIGELAVLYVAEHSASCKVLSEARAIRDGDVAVIMARLTDAVPPAPARAVVREPAPAESPPEQGSGAQPSDASPAAPWARARGSASLGYYRSWDATESSLDFEQRTARVDLGLYDIAGQPLRFNVRLRSRQDIRARALSRRTPRDERSDRLYEMALRYEPASDRLGLEAGRIGISRFVGIGYLDGVLARFRPVSGIHVGGFAGRVAEIDGLGFAGGGSKYGGFVRFTPGRLYSAGPYDVMLAIVRENAEGEVSREYLSLESRFGNGRRWSLFQRAELDINRGWREESSGTSYQLSNVSLAGNLRVTPSASAFLSYNGRRNYRYYSNRLVPAEVFDDLLHQGLRTGASYSRPGGFGATAGFGMSLKQQDPRRPELSLANAYSVDGRLRHFGLFSARVSASLDGSAFTNGYTSGGLFSMRLGTRIGAGHSLDLSYWRSFYRVKQTEQDRASQWLRLTGRAELARRVYLLVDLEYDSGDDLRGPRAFLELVFRL